VTAAIASRDIDDLRSSLETASGLGLSGAEIDEALALKAKLEAELSLTEEITAALEVKDEPALKEMLERAAAMELNNEKVRQAKIVVNRAALVEETIALLKIATEELNLEKLQTAMQQVIELGMEGEEVEAGKELTKKLEAYADVVNTLKAAQRNLDVKVKSREGIKPSDLAELEEALVMATEGDHALPEGYGERVEAVAFKEKMDAMLVVQGELALLGESDDIKLLKKTLDHAEELDMKMALVFETKKRIRTLERERFELLAAGGEIEEEDEDEDYDEAEVARLRAERLERASNPRFQWTKFSKIRSPDDFCKGVFLHKKRVKAAQLVWQNGVIHKSITELPNHDSKTSTRLHKSLLGYCGEKRMSFPATLAEDILNHGIENPQLVDEIYLQLIKHLTENPAPESMHRAWQVMCMAVGTFPPSGEFENYLLNFILEYRDAPGTVGNYARYSLRRLEGILNSGPSGFVPSTQEIDAYKERPPILATIELVDGTPLTEELPITPDLNVGKVLEICLHFLELEDPRSKFFGLFVYDVEDEEEEINPLVIDDEEEEEKRKKTPQPLRSDEFTGDVVTIKTRAGQAFKLVFKRKIFLRDYDEPSEDPMFARLVFLQAQDDFINGCLPLEDEDTVVRLVSRSVAVDQADAFPDNVMELLEAQLLEYVPYNWREMWSEDAWAEKVLETREDYCLEEPETNQADFVATLQPHPLYGSHVFFVSKANDPEAAAHLPDDMMVAFNSEGLHLCEPDEREILNSFGYADIYRWGGSSTQFSLVIWIEEVKETFELQLLTRQAVDQSSLIMDYIQAIMATDDE
jgi:hypothetical protein